MGELQRRCSPSGFFTAGNVNNPLDAWWAISTSSEVIGWLENGVDIRKYFRHVKGKCYDADESPMKYFPNSYICQSMFLNLLCLIRQCIAGIHSTSELKILMKVKHQTHCAVVAIVWSLWPFRWMRKGVKLWIMLICSRRKVLTGSRG